jgi:hypothetical protein
VIPASQNASFSNIVALRINRARPLLVWPGDWSQPQFSIFGAHFARNAAKRTLRLSNK